MSNKKMAIKLAVSMIDTRANGWEQRFIHLLRKILTDGRVSAGRMCVIQDMIDSLKSDCEDSKRREKLQLIFYKLLTHNFQKDGDKKIFFSCVLTASLTAFLMRMMQ